MLSTEVAPCVGAWIETAVFGPHNVDQASLPAWERGLKLCLCRRLRVHIRRSLRGSVD